MPSTFQDIHLTTEIFGLEERRHQRLFLVASCILAALSILFAFGWYQLSSHLDQSDDRTANTALFLRRIGILPIGLLCCAASIPVFIRLVAQQNKHWANIVATQCVFSVFIALTLVTIFCWVTTPGSVPAMQMFWMFVGNVALVFPPFLVVIFIIDILEFMNFAMQESLLASRLLNQLNTAKLESISARLQPHFLFNALQCISTLLHQDPDAADEAINRLSAVLRRSLSGCKEQLVPLKEEVEAIEEYVSIYQLRFQSRLAFQVELAKEVLDAKVPAFCLQPIVENSIHYGLDMSGAGKCVVDLSANQENGQLVVQLINTSSENPEKTNRDRHGLGLHLLRSQLEVHYESEFELDSDFDSNSATVRLKIPLNRTITE